MPQYFYPSQWAPESCDWRPSTHPPTPDVFTIYDSSGVPVGSSVMSTLVLTLYDPSTPDLTIINGVQAANIKNDGARGTISTTGVFGLKLLVEDMTISPAHANDVYERRNGLVSWTASNNRAGALMFEWVIRNLHRWP